MQPAALPAPDNTGHGTDLKTTEPQHNPRPPFPAARSSGSRPVASRTHSGAATRPGYARSLTRPAARHGHGSYQGTGDPSHARPSSRQNPTKTPLDLNDSGVGRG